MIVQIDVDNIFFGSINVSIVEAEIIARSYFT